MLNAPFHNVSRKSVNRLWFIDFNALSILMHDAISRSDATSYDKETIKHFVVIMFALFSWFHLQHNHRFARNRSGNALKLFDWTLNNAF